MRVMRSNLDGSKIETLVETGHGDADRRDARRWCVGIAVDAERGHFYWTQKGPDDAGQGSILRARIEMPQGHSPFTPTDIEILFESFPDPIDLELDLNNRAMYWTDPADPPHSNISTRA